MRLGPVATLGLAEQAEAHLPEAVPEEVPLDALPPTLEHMAPGCPDPEPAVLSYQQAVHRHQLPEQPQFLDVTFPQPLAGTPFLLEQATRPVHRLAHRRHSPEGKVATGGEFQTVRLLGGAHQHESVLHHRRSGDLVVRQIERQAERPVLPGRHAAQCIDPVRLEAGPGRHHAIQPPVVDGRHSRNAQHVERHLPFFPPSRQPYRPDGFPGAARRRPAFLDCRSGRVNPEAATARNSQSSSCRA